MLKSAIAEAQQTQHAFQQSTVAQNAKFQQTVAGMLGRLWQVAKRALSTPAGIRAPSTPNHDRNERKRQAVSGMNTNFPTPRVPEDEDDRTVQQLAQPQDQPPHLWLLWGIRLALGMKHPHDAIDQMNLDLAMSGWFRAVPHLPDSEKLERIQVFTDGSAMLERAWSYRRTSAAWGAVFVQTNSQGLDALIGFLEDVVQIHPQHPQYLRARVKTITAAELSRECHSCQ